MSKRCLAEPGLSQGTGKELRCSAEFTPDEGSDKQIKDVVNVKQSRVRGGLAERLWWLPLFYA